MKLEDVEKLHITRVAVNDALLNDKMTLDNAKVYITEPAVYTTSIVEETPEGVVGATGSTGSIEETGSTGATGLAETPEEVIDETLEDVEQGIELPTDEDVEE